MGDRIEAPRPLGSAVERGTAEICAFQNRFHKIRPAKVCTRQPRPVETGTKQAGVKKVGAGKIGTAQVRIRQRRCAQIGAAQIGPGQINVVQQRKSQIRIAQVGFAKPRACKNLAAQIGTGQKRTGQVHAKQRRRLHLVEHLPGRSVPDLDGHRSSFASHEDLRTYLVSMVVIAEDAVNGRIAQIPNTCAGSDQLCGLDSL